KSVGQGTEVKWPTGQAEVGNDGVAKHIRATLGSVGYIELSYAYRMDLPFGLVQNREQEFIKASIPSIKTAAANELTEIPDDLRYSLTNPPGKGSYPICGTTWAVIYSKQPPGKARDLARFADWMLGEGQSSVEWLFYARLPEALIFKAKQKAAEIQK